MMINPAARDGAQDVQDVRQTCAPTRPPAFSAQVADSAGGRQQQLSPARASSWWLVVVVLPGVSCNLRTLYVSYVLYYTWHGLALQFPITKQDGGPGRNRQASARARSGEARPGLRRKEGVSLRLFVLVVWLRAVGWWWCCCGCVLVQTGWCCGLFLVLPARCG